MSHDRLSSSLKCAYALPALPLAALTLPVYILVPAFYAQELGLSLAAIGTVLLLTRIFDAVTDPLVGIATDRIDTRWGRRKPWLAIGAPVAMLALYQLFNPGSDAGISHLFAWSIVLSLAWTVLILPYSAWGAELSGAYHERSEITAWREGFVILGTLLAASAAAVAPMIDKDLPPLSLLSWVLVTLIPITVWITLSRVPEPAARSVDKVDWRKGLTVMAANRPFLRLILAYALNGIANGLPATLFVLFVTHYLGAPDQVGPLLFIYFAAGIIGIPVWLGIAKLWNKHRTWFAAMLIASAAFIFVPFIPDLTLTHFVIISVITGLALGADMTLPASIQADVVDVDTLESGEQRTGLYFAAWGLTTKLSLAAAVGIAYPLLEYAGFDATRATNDGSALWVLALLYAAAPVVLKLSSMAVMWNFPIDQHHHAATRKAIEDRLTERAGSAAD